MASSHVVSALLVDVAEGVRVLRDRDGVQITDEQVLDRARNIVSGLIGNYFIVQLPKKGEPVPFHHMDGCACGACPGMVRLFDSEPTLASAAFAPTHVSVDGGPLRPIGHLSSCECGPCAEAKRKERA